jgi:hypothetical protein
MHTLIQKFSTVLGCCRESRLVWLAAFTLFAATRSFAQEPVPPQMDSNQGVESWTGGSIDDALFQSASGTTIQLSQYSVIGRGGTYKGAIVGGNPFGNPHPVTIDAVLIPLIIEIIVNGRIVLFDPTVPDPCDPGNLSAEQRFRFSPLVVPTDLKFNGVDVGTAQYIDGFMRAEFWNQTRGSSSYSNTLNWSFASAVILPVFVSPNGLIQGTTQCPQGVLSQSVFNNFMKLQVIPSLQKSGVISPTKFAFFLTKNVITATSLTPTPSGIKWGQHYATGSPAQTWARGAYNVGNDVITASHEIGEWMNDPLLTNATPSWGYLGSFPNGCSTILEVGDPVNGRSAPLINIGGHNFHVQELAFFSWFFDVNGAISLGAGGKFSSNGKFTGPSKSPCPPGGTY